jgi:hypothetical protein
MEDGEHFDFVPLIGHSVHDDIGVFDQLSRAGDESRSSHMCESVDLQERDSVPNPGDHLGRDRRIVIC